MDAFPRTLSVINQGIAQGLHIGAQLFVGQRGTTLADIAVGEARSGVPMRTNTLMLWLSASKPIIAVAIAQLWERGKLDLDDPVAKYLPTFAAGGKGEITIRHVLTHTGGFRGSANNFSRSSFQSLVERVYSLPLEAGWVPGQKAGYHIASGWLILGKLVEELAGRPGPEYVREQIFLPLGMNDCWMGMPTDAYQNYGERIGFMHDTSGPTPHVQNAWDSPESCAIFRPGAGGRGPIDQLAKFYQMLLDGGRSDHSILSPRTIQALTSPQRMGMFDHTFQHTMDWGLGFMINSAPTQPRPVPYGFGQCISPRAFGHGGSQSSGAFADPERGLVVAFVLNGMPGEVAHQKRLAAFNRALCEDLRQIV